MKKTIGLILGLFLFLTLTGTAFAISLFQDNFDRVGTQTPGTVGNGWVQYGTGSGLFNDGTNQYLYLEPNSSVQQTIDITGYSIINFSFDWRHDSTADTDSFELELFRAPDDSIDPIWATGLGTQHPEEEWFSFGIDSDDLSGENSLILQFLHEADGFDGYVDIDNVMVSGTSAPAPVPEPGTIVLLGLGLAGLGYMRRKK